MQKQADILDILKAVAPYAAGAGGGWLVGKALERLTGIPYLSWALGLGGLAAPAAYRYFAAAPEAEAPPVLPSEVPSVAPVVPPVAPVPPVESVLPATPEAVEALEALEETGGARWPWAVGGLLGLGTLGGLTYGGYKAWPKVAPVAKRWGRIGKIQTGRFLHRARLTAKNLVKGKLTRAPMGKPPAV